MSGFRAQVRVGDRRRPVPLRFRQGSFAAAPPTGAAPLAFFVVFAVKLAPGWRSAGGR